MLADICLWPQSKRLEEWSNIDVSVFVKVFFVKYQVDVGDLNSFICQRWVHVLTT